jgi:hypothetical protein
VLPHNTNTRCGGLQIDHLRGTIAVCMGRIAIAFKVVAVPTQGATYCEYQSQFVAFFLS